MQISGLFFLEIDEDFRSFLSINERVILGDVPETQVFLQLVFFNKKKSFYIVKRTLQNCSVLLCHNFISISTSFFIFLLIYHSMYVYEERVLGWAGGGKGR